MQTNFKAAQRIRITHLILPEQPQDALSRTFTISETYPLTNCVKVVEDIGCVFHMSQIELVEPSFQFTTERDLLCTAYHPYNGTDLVLVTYDKFDGSIGETLYTTRAVDDAFAEGSWTIVPEKQEAKLPDYFEITTHGGTYSMTRNNGGATATYICHGLPRSEKDAGGVWEAEGIQKYLDDGTWKLVENSTIEQEVGIDEPPSSTSQYDPATGFVYVSDVDEASEICLPQACSFLNSIKAFTDEYPASVFIDLGKYVIYYGNDELFANTDAELWDVMESIKCLEGAAKNG